MEFAADADNPGPLATVARVGGGGFSGSVVDCVTPVPFFWQLALCHKQQWPIDANISLTTRLETRPDVVLAFDKFSSLSRTSSLGIYSHPCLQVIQL